MFHEKIEEHCENVIDKLAGWLNEANSIQWYDYDIYGNSDENHCYQMLKNMLFLSFNYNTKYKNIPIKGWNSYNYYYNLKDTINKFDKTFVISYIKNSKVTDFNYKIIHLYGKEVFQIILNICGEKIDGNEYELYSLIRKILIKNSGFNKVHRIFYEED